MIKVLSLASYQFLPPKMGGQKAIALFYHYLSQHVQLTCVTTRSNDPSASEGFEVINTISNSAARYVNIFYFFRLRKLIRQKKITHLILEHPYYGWLGILLQKFTGVKLVIRSHNIEGLRWKTLGKWWWKGLWCYERFVHRRAAHSFFIQDADRQYAIREFGVHPDRCSLVSYGIGWNQPPSANEKQAARQVLQQQYGIPRDHLILLFNGTFGYPPNLEALQHIIQNINPLLQREQLKYSIIICGKDIPEAISAQDHPAMVFAGFVNDIDLYFRGSDIFLNPVISGGGIKTKLVEALGNNMNAVSSVNGAEGVDPALCGGKLVLAGNQDWPAYVKGILQLQQAKQDMPPSFFNHFYWGTIASDAAGTLASL